MLRQQKIKLQKPDLTGSVCSGISNSSVVIISLDEYNSLTATQHELSSRANEQRLDAAIEKLSKGNSFQKELIES